MSIFIVRPDGSREPFVSRPRQRRPRWRSTGRAAPRLQPVRRQRAPGRCRTGRRQRRDRPGRRVRHRLFDPTATLFVGDRSGFDPPRPRWRMRPSSRACRRASPPFIWRSARTAASTSPRRRSALATASTGVSPDGAVEIVHDGFGRPQGLAFDARGRSLRRRRAGRRERRLSARRGPPAEAEQVVAGGSLIGLAFDPHGGLVVASSDTLFRFGASPGLHDATLDSRGRRQTTTSRVFAAMHESAVPPQSPSPICCPRALRP